MDWNSDGLWDIISGDRDGFLNVFIRSEGEPGGLVAYKQYRLMDSTILDVGFNSEPNVFDWNGDGKKDLIIGREDWEILVYINQTSDTWPMFQDCQVVQAGGQGINLYRMNPYLFDLDDDGRKDLVCGENFGNVYCFRNIGDDTLPVFEAGEMLKFTDGSPVRFSGGNAVGSRCGFGDWDNDGVPDFLMSTLEGLVALYRGVCQTGVQETPKAEVRTANGPTIVRGSLRLGASTSASPSWLLDASGRRLMELQPGENDVRGLAPGVYFVRRASGEGRMANSKVVITR